MYVALVADVVVHVGLRRCGKSCRLRWLNYLRPNIKHGGFTEEEDNIICSLYISIGSRYLITYRNLENEKEKELAISHLAVRS